MLPKRVSRPPPRVLAEVVGGELGGLSEEGAELWRARRNGQSQLRSQANVKSYEKVSGLRLTKDLAWNAVSPFKAAMDMFVVAGAG